MTEPRIPVTAIILTLNEEANIARCLEGLAKVDDIVLLDSGSTDQTVATAVQKRADARLFFNQFKDFGDQRNWALNNCEPRHTWIVFVDADEFCTDDFLEELRTFVTSETEAVGAFVAGRNFFLGRWLKHCTMYPSYQLRILRRGLVSFRRDGHGQTHVTEGQIARFRTGWIHDTFSKGVAEWIARHNKYSSTDLELIIDLKNRPLDWKGLFTPGGKRHRRALKQLSTRLPFRPMFTFIYLYIVRGGIWDGRAGFIYCLLMMAHHIHILAKLAEMKAAGRTKAMASPG